MDHIINFDPYVIGEHDQQIHTEVNAVRLQGQLRKNRKVCRSSRLFALVKRGRLLVAKSRLAHQHTSRWHGRTTHFAGAKTPNHKPR